MSARATVSAVAISRRRDAPAGQDDRDIARHQRRRGGDIEPAGRTDIDLDRGLRPDGQAVADIAHVDAAIGRGGAGIEKRELEIAVLGPGLAQRHAHGAVAAFAVEHDRGDGAVVDLHFEIAPRLVGAEIVEHQHEIARRHVAVLRQRHEQLAVAAEIGEAQAVGEADIGERDLGDKRVAGARRGAAGVTGACAPDCAAAPPCEPAAAATVGGTPRLRAIGVGARVAPGRGDSQHQRQAAQAEHERQHACAMSCVSP